MGNKRRSVRFDERTWMLLNELAAMTGVSVSVVMRSMVIKGVESLLDDAGNWKLNEKQVQKE